jgi:hypothetical protein
VCFGKHNIMREQGEVPARAGGNEVQDEDALNGAEPKLGCMSLVEIAGGGANWELVRMGAIFFDENVA